MKLNYIKFGIYYLPNITAKQVKYIINKYGYLRLNYLKSYKKSLYFELLMNEKLTEHLFSVSIEAEKKINYLIKQYKNQYKLTEKNKELNQFEWIKLMNNFKNSAEEIVLNEFIYN